jgi:ribosomal protein S18 acetylase RimI-like enzyme
MNAKSQAFDAPNPAIIIRPAKMDDLPNLLVTCWRDRTPDVGRWMLTRVTRNHAEKRGMGVVAEDAFGNLTGYGQLTLWSCCAEVSDLMVIEQNRSQGFGTAIIQYLVHIAHEFGAGCVEIGAAESNPGAVRLYHRLGFEDIRTVYLNVGAGKREPVIYMRLQIDNN